MDLRNSPLSYYLKKKFLDSFPCTIFLTTPTELSLRQAISWWLTEGFRNGNESGRAKEVLSISIGNRGGLAKAMTYISLRSSILPIPHCFTEQSMHAGQKLL